MATETAQRWAMPCPNTHAPTLEMEPADPAAATPFSRHALRRFDGTLALDTDGVSRSVMAHGTFIAWTALQMIMDAVESSALLLYTRLPVWSSGWAPIDKPPATARLFLPCPSVF